MARNLRRLSISVRLMAQCDAIDLKIAPPFAAAEFRCFRIVIPANPDPFFDSCAKRGKPLPVGFRHAFARASVMKTIAEANNPRRPVSLDDTSEACQRVVAVKRGDKPASCRRVGALLQMQIGNDKGSQGRKPSCPALIEDQREAGKCKWDRG